MLLLFIERHGILHIINDDKKSNDAFFFAGKPPNEQNGQAFVPFALRHHGARTLVCWSDPKRAVEKEDSFNCAIQSIHKICGAYVRKSITIIFQGHFFVRQQCLQMLNGFLVFIDSGFRSALELLDFRFNLTFLGNDLRCYIVWWIWNFDAFVIFLECVNQSRNGNARLVVSPIDFRSAFGIRCNTTDEMVS